MMGSTWDPLSLAFSNKELELHYLKYLSIYTFADVDLAFAYFGIFTSLLMATGMRLGWFPANFCISAVVNGICGVAVVLVQARSHRAWYLKHRTAIILLMRTLRVAIGIHVAVVMPHDEFEWSPVKLVVTFSSTCMYWSVGMPLPFQV